MMRTYGALLVTFALVLGCGAEETRIRPNVYVIERTPGVDIFVEPDRLLVPQPVGEEILARRPGDILVCARGSGFLRAVVTVEPAATEVVVTTTDARLDDAIAQGRTSTTAKFAGAPGTGPAVDGKWDGVVPLDGALQVGTTTLLDTDDVTVRINRASLSFSPDVQLDLSISENGIDLFKAVAEGQATASLDVDVETRRLVRARGKIELWRSEPQLFVQWIGGIPVVEVLWLRIGVSAQVEADGPLTFGGGGEIQGDLAAGAIYDADAGWTAVGRHAITLAPEGRFDAGDTPFQFSVGLWAQIDFELYDLAGPFIRIEPYVAATHVMGADSYDPSFGVRGTWGGAIDVFGHRLSAYSRELFDVNQPF
jgi:hypothetical protein